MSGFVATPPAPASPPASKVAAGSAFWPDIDVNALRNVLRLGEGTVSHERLVGAIEGAAVSVIDQLSTWQALQTAASLGEVDDMQVNGDPVCEVLYRRAVGAAAAAELADAHADLSATTEGLQRGEDRRNSADDFRRNELAAIRGITRRGVPLPNASPRAGGCLVDLV